MLVACLGLREMAKLSQSGCIITDFREQCMRDPFSPSLPACGFVTASRVSLSDRHAVISLWGFNWHLAKG